MHTFQHYGHTFRLQHLVDKLRDLMRHPFLNLQTPREHIDNTRYFRQPNHFAAGNIGDVSATNKRQHMMFAQAVKFDVAHNHHIIIIDTKNSIVNELDRVSAVAA